MSATKILKFFGTALFLACVFCIPVLAQEAKQVDQEARLRTLIDQLSQNKWHGAQIIGDAPLIWDFGFTEPMKKLFEIGKPAQDALLKEIKNPSIKDQIIILLGGVGDERAVGAIIDAMVSKSQIKKVENAKKINRSANIALTNITVADVIWHHGGGITVEGCPKNPKKCWEKWWKKTKSTFSVKTITQSRSYSNYPNYGIYKTPINYEQ